jgi:transposase, IS6 family
MRCGPRCGTTLSGTRTTRSRPTDAQLKRRLRPMREIKTMTGLRVIAAGHAFVQNLRRGHYEIATDHPRNLRLATAFTELAEAV